MLNNQVSRQPVQHDVIQMVTAECLKQVVQLVTLSRCSRVVRYTPKIVTICKLFVYSNIESHQKSHDRIRCNLARSGECCKRV